MESKLIIFILERSFLKDEFPDSQKFIDLLWFVKEFIKGVPRYCIWIKEDEFDEAI